MASTTDMASTSNQTTVSPDETVSPDDIFYRGILVLQTVDKNPNEFNFEKSEEFTFSTVEKFDYFLSKIKPTYYLILSNDAKGLKKVIEDIVTKINGIKELAEKGCVDNVVRESRLGYIGLGIVGNKRCNEFGHYKHYTQILKLIDEIKNSNDNIKIELIENNRNNIIEHFKGLLSQEADENLKIKLNIENIDQIIQSVVVQIIKYLKKFITLVIDMFNDNTKDVPSDAPDKIWSEVTIESDTGHARELERINTIDADVKGLTVVGNKSYIEKTTGINTDTFAYSMLLFAKNIDNMFTKGVDSNEINFNMFMNYFKSGTIYGYRLDFDKAVLSMAKPGAKPAVNPAVNPV